MVEFTCCSCEKNFKIDAVDTIEQAEGATMDCPHCDKLLLVRDGKIKDFHKTIHEDCKSQGIHWPEDGKGTGYFEI